MSQFFKPVLAAMVLGACVTTVSAQSSLTLYGLVDLSVGEYQAAGAVKNKKVDNGNMTTSFWGLSGVEDLGGGLTAKFAIESFFRPATGEAGRFGTDAFWSRKSYVGLESAQLGTMTLGRNSTLMFVSTLKFNPFGDSFGFSPSIRQYFVLGGLLGDSGWSNTVAYYSPKMSGLNVDAMVTTSDAAPALGRNSSVSASYASGPFAMALTWQEVKNGVPVAPAGFKSQKATQVGASFDAKVAKFYAQWGKIKTDATVDSDNSLYQLGAAVPVLANGKVLLAYGHSDTDTGAATTTVRKVTTLGYDHNLSKRTDLYGVVMLDSKTGLARGTSYAVGMRHRF
jgi:predicted porin